MELYENKLRFLLFMYAIPFSTGMGVSSRSDYKNSESFVNNKIL